MHRLLYLVFFLSGTAALIFETVWFHLAGLTFGNSVVASSLVLSSFMGGLALGNGLVGRYGDRLRQPLRTYCLLEVLIAAIGLALVLAFPILDNVFTPLFRRSFDAPWLLNALRTSLSFTLLLLPASAMGATLPVMVKGLDTSATGFGRTLGQLYGVNTLGAVAGVVLAQWVLIERFGLRGSGFVAASMDLVAAGAGWALIRTLPAPRADADSSAPAERATQQSAYVRRLLAAAFLCGSALLALEVVWFRFMSLFMHGTSTNFALVLAVVLAGIGVGGFVASRWPAQVEARSLPFVSLSAGILVVLSYALFTSRALGLSTETDFSLGQILGRALRLMFPVSLVSGLLFTLTGRALRRELTGAAAQTRAAGYLTLANTIGAMLGALVGGFVLLPWLGISRSLFAIALFYAAVALLTCRLAGSNPSARTSRPTFAGALFLYVVVLASFPFDYLQSTVIPAVAARFPGHRIVAVREGLLQTITYLREDRFGEPFEYRMLTDGYSMSGTQERSKRYMKLYVYLPVALHPQLKSALLISYGVGSTAKALTDTRELEHIDVVDISRDVLEMSSILFPDQQDHPLADPRVHVHVEDGRFFLQASERSYDLITAEPPPLKAANIHRLYSKEYFELLHERLAPGGMATYWLPIYQLDEPDYRAIVRGFCEAFEDCSLWTGSGPHWMLLGVREGGERVDEERFTAQWRDPVVGPELKALGFEYPEQLGALYIDDGAGLRQRCRDTPPLVDDYPYRLSPRFEGRLESSYRELMEIEPAWIRFDSSEHIRRLWPDALRHASRPYFAQRHVLNRALRVDEATVTGKDYYFRSLNDLLTKTSLETLPLWWLNSSVREQRIVESLPPVARDHAAVDIALGAGALAKRDYSAAAAHYHRAFDRLQKVDFLMKEILSLVLAGEHDLAAERSKLLKSSVPGAPLRRYFKFLRDDLGFELAGIPP